MPKEAAVPIPCAVLMCHAPIVIPAIAGRRAAQCARTTAAMKQAAQCLVAHAPDVIVIISPHTPRDPLRFGIVQDARLSGDFGRFGVPEVGVELPGAQRAAAALARSARELGLSSWSPSGQQLDHGALVPLYFVREAGWRGPTLLLALPYPDSGLETAMGRAIARAANELGERWCVLASGDMSHRLTPDAPAGYHPNAARFDAGFRDLIDGGELEQAAAFPTQLREIAAEDVVDSCTVAAAAVGFDARGHRVLSYEGPFGVGYLEAVLHESAPPPQPQRAPQDTPDEQPPRALLGIARAAIAAYLRGQAFEPPELPPPWSRSRGVFVTLRTAQGELRGCIGHIEPGLPTLGYEVASCAISSATRDARFAPVELDDLDGLRIEISVLSPPEPIASLDQLDPERFGVVVSSGQARGVLLPGIEGVHTARDQVRIAAAKAGLGPNAPLQLERFEVRKLCDEDDLVVEPQGRPQRESRVLD